MAKKILLLLVIGIFTYLLSTDVWARTIQESPKEEAPPAPTERPRYPHDESREPKRREVKKKIWLKRELSSHVVGIGASAGGLKAIKEILQYLPKDIDTAYIIVQHPDPKDKTIYANELSGLTDMSIFNAEDGMAIKRNRIYVIPAGVNMCITNNVLKIVPREGLKDPDMPINQFFTSLAEDQEEKAVGIILSGDVSDGANGLVEINNKGGQTIVQDKDTAEYSKMPESAISTGIASLILPPKEIAMELKKLRGPMEKKSVRVEEGLE